MGNPKPLIVRPSEALGLEKLPDEWRYRPVLLELRDTLDYLTVPKMAVLLNTAFDVLVGDESSVPDEAITILEKALELADVCVWEVEDPQFWDFSEDDKIAYVDELTGSLLPAAEEPPADADFPLLTQEERDEIIRRVNSD